MSLTLEAALKELEAWKSKAKANYDLAEGRAKLLNKIHEKVQHVVDTLSEPSKFMTEYGKGKLKLAEEILEMLK